jgi:hypothetical protein
MVPFLKGGNTWGAVIGFTNSFLARKPGTAWTTDRNVKAITLLNGGIVNSNGSDTPCLLIDDEYKFMTI